MRAVATVQYTTSVLFLSQQWADKRQILNTVASSPTRGEFFDELDRGIKLVLFNGSSNLTPVMTSTVSSKSRPRLCFYAEIQIIIFGPVYVKVVLVSHVYKTYQSSSSS